MLKRTGFLNHHTFSRLSLARHVNVCLSISSILATNCRKLTYFVSMRKNLNPSSFRKICTRSHSSEVLSSNVIRVANTESAFRKKKVDSIAKTTSIFLYTDGSCRGNRNVQNTVCPAGWGVCIVRSPEMIVELELFGPVPLSGNSKFFLGAAVGSNNTAELTAIGEALRWLRDFGSIEKYPGNVCIRYDSEYAAKSVQGIYNGKKNCDLIHRIRLLYKEVSLHRKAEHSVIWEHVKGHSNDAFNDRADSLALQGSSGELCKTGHYADA